MWLIFFAAWCALAQTSAPSKAAATDYPAHAVWSDFTIGAEYMAASIAGPRGGYLAARHLAVDVAVYPPRGKTVMLSSSRFALLVNGKRLKTDTPAMVLAAIRNAEYDQRGKLQTVLVAGPVSIGRPRPVERFPGDPGDRQTGQRPPPQDEALAKVVTDEALPEYLVEQPVRGYLYFPWTAKLKSVKRVELIYRDAENRERTLTLR